METKTSLNHQTPPMTQNHCYTLPFSEVYNEDCIEVMKRYEDNYFDIAIVDPPYGLDINSSGTHFKEKYEIKDWDKATPDLNKVKSYIRDITIDNIVK